MYKCAISLGLKPGALEQILQRSPNVQRLTRADAGCVAYDFFTCADEPHFLVSIESFVSKQAHALHCEQRYAKDFIAFHEPFHVSFTLEPIGTEDS